MKFGPLICRAVAGTILLAFSSGALSAAASAQQPGLPLVQATKPVIEEWVYRTKYGYKDEWFRIFKKYQIAILERQKALGYVKEYTVYAPSLHTSEDSRWDYRVIIVRASQDAPLASRKTRSQNNSSLTRPLSKKTKTGDGNSLPTTGIFLSMS